MDGVSAALGVASFADVLIRTVAEIHAFYKSIKNAPQTVTAILADLELLSDVLQDFSSLGRFPERSDSVTLDKVRTLCNIKVRNLVGIADKLKHGFDSQGKSQQIWARCKTVKKEEKLRDFRRSLEETKSTLILALHHHSMCGHSAWLTRKMTDLIPQEVMACIYHTGKGIILYKSSKTQHYTKTH
ncbi:hypothetical protein EV356DRAFT_7067 [Viridothelium virens]|uniref:Azaphilone pigments biosynthesis cluster protein L N-terminal domain-containing protein n=1 Tax=Viridothelium virens TaxID=1048519 RepID=A0A6A6HQB9_VIRVR|nr:hypothetical protein EV356DRAFT_7067 [Viridothelium virens]